MVDLSKHSAQELRTHTSWFIRQCIHENLPPLLEHAGPEEQHAPVEFARQLIHQSKVSLALLKKARQEVDKVLKELGSEAQQYGQLKRGCLVQRGIICTLCGGDLDGRTPRAYARCGCVSYSLFCW